MYSFSIRSLYRSLKMKWYRYIYKLKNVHPTFYMGRRNIISSDLRAGEYSFIGANCWIPPKVSIGKYTMLASNVSILGGDHIFSDPTNPMIFSGRPAMPQTKIGADVWIGSNALIMAGVTIGNGSIIAAGSVVTKDIPEYSIWGGNPAKPIRMRFNDQEIDLHKKMLKKKDIKVNLTKKKK